MGFHWNELHIRPRMLVLLFTALLAASLVYFLQFGGNMDQRILYGILVVAVLSTAGALYEFIYRIEETSLTGLYRRLTDRTPSGTGRSDGSGDAQDREPDQ